MTSDEGPTLVAQRYCTGCRYLSVEPCAYSTSPAQGSDVFPTLHEYRCAGYDVGHYRRVELHESSLGISEHIIKTPDWCTLPSRNARKEDCPCCGHPHCDLHGEFKAKTQEFHP